MNLNYQLNSREALEKLCFDTLSRAYSQDMRPLLQLEKSSNTYLLKQKIKII